MGLLSAAGSLFSGIGLLDQNNKKASKKATKAVTEAAEKNRALFEKIYNESRNDLAPGRAVYGLGVNALSQRFGLTPMTRPATRPASQEAALGPSGKAASAGGPPPGYVPGAEAAARRAADGVGGGVNPQGAGTVKMNNTGREIVGYGPNDQPIYAAGSQPTAFDPGSRPTQYDMAAPSGPDWQAYLDANPDVAANAAQRAQAEGIDPLTVAQQHWQNFGQTEGRTMPQMGEAAADPNAPPDEYYQETYAERPDAMEVPTYQRAPDMEAPTYGAGPQFSWDPSQIAKDAGYLFETAETTKGVNAGAAARGKLRSGDAARALQDRLFGVAHTYGNDYFNRAMQGYNANRNAFESDRGFTENRYRYGQDRGDRNFLDDRSYGTNLWNTQQNRADNVFSEDRGFQANRFDQGTANLFNLTNMGQNAAAGTANAGNIFASNTAAQNNNVAQTQANGALWRAGQLNNMFGSALNFAGQYLGGGF